MEKRRCKKTKIVGKKIKSKQNWNDDGDDDDDDDGDEDGDDDGDDGDGGKRFEGGELLMIDGVIHEDNFLKEAALI